MALFSQSEKQQNQASEPQKPPQINANVLRDLNLTQTDIDSHYKNQQVESVKKEVTLEASTYYQEVSSGQISFSEPRPIKLGEIALQPKVQHLSQIPDSLQAEFKIIEKAMHSEDREHVKIYIDTFNSNFGQKALDSKDWETAICAFDVATEGGIIQKPDVIKKLGEIFTNDLEARRQIAETIQHRIDLRSATPKVDAGIGSEADENTQDTSANIIQFSAPKLPITTAEDLPNNVTPINRMATAMPEQIIQPVGAETIVQPVGAPTTPILGETTLQPNLRAAPPNPNPVPTPLAKAA